MTAATKRDERADFVGFCILPPKRLPCGCDKRHTSNSLQPIVRVTLDDGKHHFLVCVQCDSAHNINGEQWDPVVVGGTDAEDAMVRDGEARSC